jgi:hypothetical protein
LRNNVFCDVMLFIWLVFPDVSKVSSVFETSENNTHLEVQRIYVYSRQWKILQVF